MKACLAAAVLAAALACGIGTTVALAQGSNAAVITHVAAAKTAAGAEWAGVFGRVCSEAVPPSPPPERGAAGGRGGAPAGPPERSTWHAEPVKVFDNLYFLGQTEYSAWAVTTSAGIIIIDTIFDYSVQDEVEGGLKKMGLDPASDQVRDREPRPRRSLRRREVPAGQVRRARLSWPPRTGTCSIGATGTKPKRDMVATDGMKLTLGDTTLTIYKTPGHTLGTISTLIPVKDNGVPHVAAYWGGTAFNWVNGPQNYITPDRPDRVLVQDLQRFGEALPRHRVDGRRRRHPLEPHDLRRLEDRSCRRWRRASRASRTRT